MENTNPKYIWKETSDQIGGSFSVSKQPITGGSMTDLFLLKIRLAYKGVDIEIHSSYFQAADNEDEFGMNILRITSRIDKQENFHLYLWRKGFIEKILSTNKNKTGFNNFDSSIGFDSNNITKTKLLFSETEIREMIINDRTSTFNVQYENNSLTVNYQSRITNNKEEILSELNKYIIFIDGLIKYGVIIPLPVTLA
ncbi:MAG: hypothetical protein HXX16_20155 [Bacteroidales bacterium]|nr:hypothetical protein [Bacteroidales bacterium]